MKNKETIANGGGKGGREHDTAKKHNKPPPVKKDPAPPPLESMINKEDYNTFRKKMPIQVGLTQAIIIVMIIVMIASSSRWDVNLRIDDVSFEDQGNDSYQVIFKIYNKGFGSADDVVIIITIFENGKAVHFGYYYTRDETIGMRETEIIQPGFSLDWNTGYVYTLGIYWEDGSQELGGSFFFQKW